MNLMTQRRRLSKLSTQDLVSRYVALRFKEMDDEKKRGKERAARREIEIASTLYDRKGGVRALEEGLAAARLKS